MHPSLICTRRTRFLFSFLVLSTAWFCWHCNEEGVIAKVTQLIVIRSYSSFHICKTPMEYNNFTLEITIEPANVLSHKKTWHHLTLPSQGSWLRKYWYEKSVNVCPSLGTWAIRDEESKIYGRVWPWFLLHLWKKWIRAEKQDLRDGSYVTI